MSISMTIAFACHLVGVLIGGAFGLVYLSRKRFMPYHAIALGKEWDAVSSAVQVLILVLMRATGGGLIAVAFLNLVLLLIPFRAGEVWAVWAIPLSNLMVSAGALYAMHIVSSNTPARPPKLFAIASILLTLTGLELSIL
ncbi:hypothetical protein [Nodosilinea sp. E11]|uniref:hypothetical protein n=1 Tax=Nodosilinea sp. E11 TaxID=3037479 RepID=UPI002934E6D0|nr:hypothetical protein [Nodosilinea sp. E11]WOD39523.1 hypothetical protein RRF56_25275 [Nodosilinea sp. E11]